MKEKDSPTPDATNANLSVEDGSGQAKKKKNARIVCANDKEFWTTQKQFWVWVREGLVDVTGQRPLTGRFAGKRERLLVMVRHVILDNANPIHKGAVLDAYAKLPPHTTKMRDEDRKKPENR
ncbi:MAG: hypothetical protein HY231_21355 [Acidobacteria bacterium]|nr:hypothetical protein [Acidobacteriota bacterium]